MACLVPHLRGPRPVGHPQAAGRVVFSRAGLHIRDTLEDLPTRPQEILFRGAHLLRPLLRAATEVTECWAKVDRAAREALLASRGLMQVQVETGSSLSLLGDL